MPTRRWCKTHKHARPDQTHFVNNVNHDIMHPYNKICRNLAIGLSAALCLALCLPSCRKDSNPPQASQKPDMRYQLPQGNASFDASILNFFHTYDTYILYKFSGIDFNYQFSYNLAQPPNANISAIQGPVVMRGGDSIAIQSALDFMDQYWFSFYPEDFKKKFLPQKILLAGLMYTTRYTSATKIYDTPRVNPITVPIEGVDHITLPKIDTAFNTYPLASKLLLKAQVNRIFLKHLMYPMVNSVPPLVPLPAEFFKVSDYTLGGLTKAQRYKYGFDTLAGANAPSPYTDILSYLDTICAKPRAALDAYMFTPKVDSLGLMKRKYDILVNYFKTNYNVDIQAIGEKQN